MMPSTDYSEAQARRREQIGNIEGYASLVLTIAIFFGPSWVTNDFRLAIALVVLVAALTLAVSG